MGLRNEMRHEEEAAMRGHRRGRATTQTRPPPLAPEGLVALRDVFDARISK